MTVKLGKNQLIALKFAATRGEHAPAGDRPWQLSNSQYRRVLDSLVERGLVRRDDERGVLSVTLHFKNQDKSPRVFTPFYEVTDAGHRVLTETGGPQP